MKKKNPGPASYCGWWRPDRGLPWQLLVEATDREACCRELRAVTGWLIDQAETIVLPAGVEPDLGPIQMKGNIMSLSTMILTLKETVSAFQAELVGAAQALTTARDVGDYEAAEALIWLTRLKKKTTKVVSELKKAIAEANQLKAFPDEQKPRK